MIGRRARSLLRSAARRLGGPRPVILMYHRVATPTRDPWALAVSPTHFAEHVDHLARHRRPMTLDRFVRRLADGTLPRDAVAVTFDDGYVDNLRHALPVLAARRVPATLFLASDARQRGRPFWWDELGAIVFDHAGPMEGVVRIGESDRALIWDGEPEEAGWLGWEAPRTARQAVFVDLWTTMRQLTGPARRAALDALSARLGPARCEADRAMDDAELRRLVDDGVFDLGAHSVTHPDLRSLSPEARRHEIAQSRRDCEALAGRAVPGFAYPYGDFDDAVRAEVVACGFAWACSTRPGHTASAAVDRYVLPRIGIGDWPADRFAAALAAA